jgi:uncharacterized protein DUF6916
MSANLTEEEFSKHVNTKFRVAGEQLVELELDEVKSYPSRPNEQMGMERFSIFFTGPGDSPLEQKVYSLEHEKMGAFDLFLVPVSRNESGFRYEAVFNYFKNR